MEVLTPRRRSSGALAKTLFVGTVAVLAACSGGDKAAGPAPKLPGDPTGNPTLRKAAFVADVNMRSGKVTFTAPAGTTVTPSLSGGSNDPSFSILAGDAVQLVASNFAASAVGAVVPGKVTVTFDISILNKLQGYALITPTFPDPPVAGIGPLLFPFSTNVTTTAGGVSVGGDGTEVIVDLPSNGEVTTGLGWDGDGSAGSGAPNNFFNDTGCGAGSNDCYRWEAYGELIPDTRGAAGAMTKGIPSLATSAARSVSFDIDPTVGQFRSRLIVAADLMAASPPKGDIVGSVSSPQRGALAGVQVTVDGVTGSQTTDASGSYAFRDLAIGPKTVRVNAASLPSTCSAPAQQDVNVTSGGSATANFSVTCAVPAGTVAGRITRSDNGLAISGASVVVTPDGGAAQAAVSSSASGDYSRSGVPVGSTGSGSIALSNLPASCTNPGPVTYAGLTENGTAVRDIIVSCTPAPQGYNYRAIATKTATQVTIELRIDMSTYDDPAVVDNYGSLTANFTFDPNLLTFNSAASANTAQPGVTTDFNVPASAPNTLLMASTATTGQLGDVLIGRVVFDIKPAVSGSFSTVTTVDEITNDNGVLLQVSKVLKTEATVTVP